MTRAHLLTAVIAIATVLLMTRATAGAAAQDDPRPWGPPPPVSVHEGEHYRVHCHFDTAKLGEEAVAAVDLAWDATHRVLDARPKKTDLLDVHLYRNRDDYNAADRRITGGRFTDNLAFSIEAGPSAHVALQPELDDTVFARTGLSERTLRTLIHEAVHLAVYSSMSNHSDHPQWFAEGLATTVADRVLVDEELAPDTVASPTPGRRMVRVRALLDDGRLPTPRELIEQDLPDEIGHDESYAIWWVFFRYLTETHDGARLRTAIDSVRSLGAGDGFRDRLAKRLEKAWGKKDLDGEMADEFREYVLALEPEWDQVFGTTRIVGDTWTQLAWPEKNAIMWRTAPVGRTKYTVSGTLELLFSTNPQMNLLLGRTPEGFVSLAFRANGGVTIFDHRAEGNQWNNVGWLDAPDLQIGARLDFEVVVKGDRLTIGIGDTDPLSWTIDGRDLTGPWGIGVQSNGAGVWTGIEVK